MSRMAAFSLWSAEMSNTMTRAIIANYQRWPQERVTIGGKSSGLCLYAVAIKDLKSYESVSATEAKPPQKCHTIKPSAFPRN